MKSIFAAACVATLILAGTTFADHRSSGGTTASSHRGYHQAHGKSFSHGTYYQGRNHYHWSNYRWSAQYGCYTYYCPSTSVYYYWSEPTQCYYPVSYAETVAPTRSTYHLDLTSYNYNYNP
jgi:hypothetical protein